MSQYLSGLKRAGKGRKQYSSYCQKLQQNGYTKCQNFIELLKSHTFSSLQVSSTSQSSRCLLRLGRVYPTRQSTPRSHSPCSSPSLRRSPRPRPLRRRPGGWPSVAASTGGKGRMGIQSARRIGVHTNMMLLLLLLLLWLLWDAVVLDHRFLSRGYSSHAAMQFFLLGCISSISAFFGSYD